MRRLFTIFALLSVACTMNAQAQCDSVNTAITDKFRYLGEWDSNGIPLYQETPSDVISDELVSFVENTLPESTRIPATSSYFSDTVQLNTVLNDSSEVYLTFVTEGAGWDWNNSLGFYTYPTDNPPSTVDDLDSLVIALPNTSRAPLPRGTKIKLGKFGPNTTIGFFLLAKGWNDGVVCLNSHILFTDKQLNTYIQEGYKQQTIQLSYPDEELFLIGFEDQIRPGGDNDFNDVVFYVKADADTTNIPEVATATISGDTILCNAESKANIQVNFTGKAPFTMVYNDGSADYTVSGITSKSYTFQTSVRDTVTLVSVMDANGYGIVKGSAVIQQNLLSATLPESINLCSDESPSAINIDFNGTGDYSFSYTDGSDTTSVQDVDSYQFTPEVGKTYTLIEVYNDICYGEVSGTFKATQHDFPELQITAPEKICSGATMEEINLTFSGEGPYTFEYSLNGNSSTSFSTSESSETIIINGATTFTPISLNNGYCEGTVPEAITIEEADQPEASISGGGAICENEEATITFNVTGVAPYTITYLQDGTEKTIVTSDTEYLVSTYESGVYQLVSIEDAYCSQDYDESVEVTNLLDELTAEIETPESICENEPFTIKASVDGTYNEIKWSTTGKGDITQSEDGITYTPATDEYGTISFTAEAITDCGNKSFTTSVDITHLDDIDFTVSPEQPLDDSDVIFIPSDSNLDSYYWDFGDGSTNSYAQTTHIYTDGGKFLVKLTVTKNGCETDVDKYIDVYSKAALYVPNVFNPSASNPENRVVKVYGNDISNDNFFFRIVNRWGNTMYETSSFDEANSQGWDGVDPDFDEPQPLTVFSYILRGKFNDGSKFDRTGTVTLLR